MQGCKLQWKSLSAVPMIILLLQHGQAVNCPLQSTVHSMAASYNVNAWPQQNILNWCVHLASFLTRLH